MGDHGRIILFFCSRLTPQDNSQVSELLKINPHWPTRFEISVALRHKIFSKPNRESAKVQDVHNLPKDRCTSQLQVMGLKLVLYIMNLYKQHNVQLKGNQWSLQNDLRTKHTICYCLYLTVFKLPYEYVMHSTWCYHHHASLEGSVTSSQGDEQHWILPKSKKINQSRQPASAYLPKSLTSDLTMAFPWTAVRIEQWLSPALSELPLLVASLITALLFLLVDGPFLGRVLVPRSFHF